MKPTLRLFAILFAVSMLLAQMPLVAQTSKMVEKKKALLKQTLEEKNFHLQGLKNMATGSSIKSGARTTATDERITTNPAHVDEGEISVIYDPTDSNNLILSYMEQSTGLTFPVYYSSNGGTSWTLSDFNSLSIMSADFPGQLPAGGGDPSFAWDKNGKVYFAWIYLTINSAFDTAYFTLNWAYSNDKGHTWHTVANHFIGRGAINATTQTILPYKDGITDREWLTVDNSGGPHQGNVYCSFVNFPSDSTAPSFEGIKVLIPAADTFGPIVPAYVGGTQFGNVEVDKNGTLHMSLADLDSNFVRHVASTNGGMSFATSEVVARTGIMFPSAPFVVQYRENAAINMAVDGTEGTGNNVHIVWSDLPGAHQIH